VRAACRRRPTSTTSATGRSRPDDLVRQIVYAIDQPWGVTINDITVRATGEDYVR
jgi:NADP-dependent 3-hydroxy acid dehydrogenase YdfG